MIYYGIADKEHYLAHAGKKGMKWGYTDGVRNGKRTAEEIEEALNQLKAKLQSGAEDISEKAEAVKEAAKKKVEDGVNKAKETLNSIKNSTVREVKEAAAKGKEFIDKIKPREKKTFEEWEQTRNDYNKATGRNLDRDQFAKEYSHITKKAPGKKTFSEWQKEYEDSNKTSGRNLTNREWTNERIWANNRKKKKRKKTDRAAKSSAPSRGVYFTVGPDGQTIRER